MEETQRLFAKPELAEYVHRQGRLQTWLAAIIGKDKSYITHVMKRRRSITPGDAERIALALGIVDIFVLFEFADATEHVAERAVA